MRLIDADAVYLKMKKEVRSKSKAQCLPDDILGYLDSLDDIVQKVCEAPTAIPWEKTPWVSVNSHLPSLDLKVLIFANGKVREACYASFGGYPVGIRYGWTNGDHTYWDCNEVTHWMPLPPPPDSPRNAPQKQNNQEQQ